MTLCHICEITQEGGARMHERERHRIILSAVQEKPVGDDSGIFPVDRGPRKRRSAVISRPCMCRKRSGVSRRCGIDPPSATRQSRWPPLPRSEGVNIDKKRAIARRAAELCGQGDAIHHQWRHHDIPARALSCSAYRMQVMTNSFAIAEHLVKHSKNTGDGSGRRDSIASRA